MKPIIVILVLVALTAFGALYLPDPSVLRSFFTGEQSCRAGTYLNLKKPYPLDFGHAYSAIVPQFTDISDTTDTPQRSRITLCEDGRALGPAHSLHDDIRKLGNGRFSHWVARVIFSSSDNSDPNTNGREYVIVMRNETVVPEARKKP
jgi:hypothetical protein